MGGNIQREIRSFGTRHVPGTSPLALRVGNCVFFSTLAGTDAETGLLLRGEQDLAAEVRAFLTRDRHIDPMEWEVVAQTWGIFKAFELGMRQFGGSIDDLVRTNTFFGKYYDFIAFERTRMNLLKSKPPASTVMETGWRNVDPRIKVLMHGWGMLRGADHAYAKDAITTQKVAAAGAHYSLALCSGPFIWPSGQVGRNPKTEQYVQHWSELPEDAPSWLKSGNRHVDHREGPVSAQAWLAYDNLFKILAERGCTKNDILHETIYVKNIDQLPALDRVRSQIWPDPSTAPAATVVQTADIGRVPLAQLEIDFVALRPGNAQGWTRKATVEVDGLRSALHGPVVTQAGVFRFVAAQHGLLALGRLAADRSELSGSLQALHAGHVYAERPAEAQSCLIYDRLQRILESTGASLGHLAKVNAYFDDAADIPSFQRIGALALDGAVHATATVPVKRSGRTPDHVLIADGIAIVD